jgi:isoaspartyl peptidase/L-asparaginase-like protein (Ntn-hydrolase superfamily)
MNTVPQILSTWSFGAVANDAAWPILSRGGSALDAAVEGATAVENDPSVDSVGVGGFPDADGRVSLDACVMENPDRCGSACFVRSYANVAKIARAVMDKTIHVMLAGDGVEKFAASQGFVKHPTDLLTESAKQAWKQWRAEHDRAGVGLRSGKLGVLPAMNVEERYKHARGVGATPGVGHDTVCVLARDTHGKLAGVCTTSGLGFKIPGRVGDSPIIGHGLYVDNEVGGASATGNGELVMGVCGSFLAVELMRQGREPIEAITEVLTRISKRYAIASEQQVAMIVMRRDGAWASAALRDGFAHCYRDGSGSQLAPAQRVLLN